MTDIFLSNLTYSTKQTNGQRITGPPQEITKDVSASDIELYVSNIPFDMFAPDLLPIFAQAGPIYKFRLMMKISGQNRGFGYLTYLDNASTQRALDLLENIPMRMRRTMHISVSKNHRRLLLCNVGPGIPDENLLEWIAGPAPGVERMYIFEQYSICYVSITYISHRDAALARRILVPNMLQFGPYSRLIWDRSLTFNK